ncbi:nuclear transport factor 2 family protein [Patulibacter defluvii]|uniref:nuclear transport factor 2 family protein n=1 Tax=Patulibacter defluvii TaxID=3095358 RepID=UPI002A7583AD|nr:nuclear transport factor 2 family protein [Patulibacter sp. DM4]
MSTTAAFDLPAFVAAIEARDAETQIALFAEDAVVTTCDHEHPPSRPLVARGRDEIAAQLRDVVGRDMTHRVTDALVTDDRLVYALDCAYPDGTHVHCQVIAQLADGRISAQSGVQTWDH